MDETPQRDVPPEAPEAHGVDDPGSRPGVPMEAEASPAEGAHGPPRRQDNVGTHLVRAGLEEPTPVVGTAQRPHGLSGVIRRRAYEIPEHYARHWSLLLLADRVDVMEDRLGEAMARPLERMGMDEGARRVRENPLPVLAATVVGAWLAKRVLR